LRHIAKLRPCVQEANAYAISLSPSG
jgi:hypothetical protein